MIQDDLPAGWQWKTIGEVCRVVPGFAFKSKDWTNEGIPVIKIKNIKSDCTVDVSEADCVPEEIVTEKLNQFRLGKGDILIAMTGATAGKVGWLSADGGFLLNQRVAKLEPVWINKLFFWGVVSGRRYQKLFFHLADGAAQPNMSGKQIEGVPIPVPPVALQETIAGMVAAFDDLIENNTRRIAILEEMARRLYEEWFVHFRFPGHEDSRIAPKSVGELAEVIRGRSYRSHELAEEGGLPFVNLKCIDRDGGFRRSGLKRFNGKFKPDQRVRAGDIVMAVTDMTQERRIVARAGLVPELGPDGGVISMDLVRVVPREEIPALFLYAALRWSDFAENIKDHASGVNVLHLHPDQIRAHRVLSPPAEVQREFAERIEPNVRLAECLERKNTKLRAQRDLLLPKLVSGEIDIVDARTTVEEAVA